LRRIATLGETAAFFGRLRFCCGAAADSEIGKEA
jgi:hypothetical protein